jgi:hypothetical protein
VTTSSAHPAELRDYVSRTRGALIDVADAAVLVTQAVADLQAALPEGHQLTTIADLTLPAVSRAHAVDAQVSITAAIFDAAGRGDGVVTVDDTALPAFPPVYDQATIDALTARLEDELATLKERLAASSADETTLDELLGLLGMARTLTDRADVKGHSTEAAAELIDRMGAGDVAVMLDMLEGAVLDDDPAAAREGFEDLGIVLSRGLETQPTRVDRWLDTLTAGHSWIDSTPEALVALAALGAPGARAFGGAVWSRLLAHRDDALPSYGNGPLRGPSGGLLERVFGTPSAVAVMVDATAERPGLANGIVTNTNAEVFEDLVGDRLNDTPWPAAVEDRFNDVLAASIDPSLPLNHRLESSLHVMGIISGADGLNDTYSDATLTTLGTMTHPLLANTGPGKETIVFDRPAGTDATESATPLWGAVGNLGNTDAGTVGVRIGLERAIADRFAAGLTGDPGEPVALTTLRGIAEVRAEVVTEAIRERLEAIERRLERGDPVSAGIETLLLEGASMSAQAQPIAVGLQALQAARDGQGVQVVEGGRILGDNAGEHMVYRLVLADIATSPDIATPQLVEALNDAALEGLRDDNRRSAALGVYSFVMGDTRSDAVPGLSRLRELLSEQESALRTDSAENLDAAHG